MIQTLKTSYLDSCSQRWEKAIEGLEYLYSQYPKELKLIANNWDLLSFDIGFCAPDTLKPLRYDFPYELIEAIEWLRFFISHELFDDGSPTIIFVSRTYNTLHEKLDILTSVPMNDPLAEAYLLCRDRWDIECYLQANTWKDYHIDSFKYIPKVAEPADFESLSRAIELMSERREGLNRSYIKDAIARGEDFKPSYVQQSLIEIVEHFKLDI
jgi:hypothetical protein